MSLSQGMSCVEHRGQGSWACPEHCCTPCSESGQACLPPSSFGMAFVHILPYFKGLCPKYSSVLPPVLSSLLLPEMPFPLFSVDEIDVVGTGTLQEASFGFHPGGAASGHPRVLVLAQIEGNVSLCRSSLLTPAHA